MRTGEGYEPAFQTDLALEFLQDLDRSQPFCLALSWGPPHDPYWMVPAEHRRSIDGESITLRPNVQAEVENPLTRGVSCREAHANYRAAILALDDQFGRLMRGLEALGLAEETCVVFTSDHGDMLWSHGWLKKQAPFLESISIPFILRHPDRVRAESVCSLPMGTPDFLPTLCGLLDWPAPSSCEGIDLSGHFQQSYSDSDRELLIANHMSSDEAGEQNMPEWRGLYSRRLTYVEQAPGIPWLLFDNQEDPFQLNNLLDDPMHSETVAALHERLHQRLRTRGDRFLSGIELLKEQGHWSSWCEIDRNRYTPAYLKKMQASFSKSANALKGSEN